METMFEANTQFWSYLPERESKRTFILLLLLKVADSESGGELCLTAMLCFVLGMLLLVVTREQWLCTEWDLDLHFHSLAGVRHPDFTEKLKCF